jgi:glycosyltransferase involved in cell wall biosynthesis
MGAASLRDVLERILKDPPLAAELGRRALSRVRAHYSWDAVADAYERLFREVLARP